MKAVICTKYGPPEVLQIREVPKPHPKKNEVGIKVRTTAVTASDAIVRGFKLSRWQPMGIMMALAIGIRSPRKPILGMVLSGEVESVGSEVSRFQVGDLVYGSTLGGSNQIRFGAYAQYVCLPQNSRITHKPGNINGEEAAAIPYGFGLAIAYLKKGDIQAGQNVMIYGASGAIGTTAVQLARAFGATVTGVCSTRNQDLVRSLGADHMLDYTKDDAPPAGERYDLVLDAVGENKSSRLKEASKTALTANGRYISVDDGSPRNTLDELDLLNDLVETGKLKAVIDRTYPLQQIVEAHRYVDKGHKRGNVVITVT